jgi:hypothetical protein
MKHPVREAIHQEHVYDKPETYISGLGTVRTCIDCGCLVSGGPTRCVRCAEQCELNWFQRTLWKLLGIWHRVETLREELK